MKKIMFFILISLVGCAPEVARIAETPSGRPEVTFDTTNIGTVVEKITNRCATKGLLVQSSTPNEVVCGGQISGDDALLATLLMGNAHSTPPEQFIKFTIFKSGSKIRVQAYQWIQTQMAFGQINKQELNGSAQFNQTLTTLVSLGGTPVTTN